MAYPWLGLIFAGLILVGRLLFCIGYTIGGPAWRLPGALLMDVGLILSFIMLVVASIKLGIDQ